MLEKTTKINAVLEMLVLSSEREVATRTIEKELLSCTPAFVDMNKAQVARFDKLVSIQLYRVHFEDPFFEGDVCEKLF